MTVSPSGASSVEGICQGTVVVVNHGYIPSAPLRDRSAWKEMTGAGATPLKTPALSALSDVTATWSHRVGVPSLACPKSREETL